MNRTALNAFAIIFSFFCVWMALTLPQETPVATTPTGKIAAEAGVKYQPPQPKPRVSDPFRPFLDALMQVESGGDCNAVGKDGERGVYQIGKSYWQDVCGDDYEKNVLQLSKSEIVMFAYWNRYERKALSELDFETLARLHNGGPRWREKPATIAYWRKAKATMKSGE